MKKNEAKVIFTIIAIMVVILIIVIANKGKKGKNDNGAEGSGSTVAGQEFVTVQGDGTKVNKSSKLSETKKFDGYEISNITLTEKGNVSLIKATIKNTTSEKKGDEWIVLTILDKDGKTLTEVKGYPDTLQPGATATLSISTSADFANAYDFKVRKLK